MQDLKTVLGNLIAHVERQDSELAKELISKQRKIPSSLRGLVNESAVEASGLGETGMVNEAIILRTGRPVLEVFRDEAKLDFRDADSEVWRERLIRAKSNLARVIPAVGRIELKNFSAYQWVGTGWLIRPDIIVTNSHVATLFSTYKNELAFYPGVEASIDFIEEFARNSNERTFRLRKVLHIEDLDVPGNPDLAFFQLDRLDGIEPVPLSTRMPKAAQQVAVIGYPARNWLMSDQELVERIFGDIFDKKRLAPGQVTGLDSQRVLHDCTTSGGNSGSVVYDFQAGEAIALHFSGRPFDTNYAVRADLVRERLEQMVRGGSRPRSEISRKTEATPINPSPSMNSLNCTIPIRIRIEVGPPEFAPDAVAPRLPAAVGVGKEAEEILSEAPPESYANRKGFDPGFLGEGMKAPLPQVVRDRDQILKFDFRGEKETELCYEHFSVLMNKQRRMCFFSAVNVDGKTSQKSTRVGWQWDSRIPKSVQIKDECYGNEPKFSRGHMTRREDPVWGSPESAGRGNQDSMHVTNVVPQMQPFNAGIWLGLEDYALKNARKDKMRLCVFTGPLFNETEDPIMFGVKIPVEFWKIIVFIHDQTGELSATGYSLSQKDFLTGQEFVFGRHKTYQRSLAWIEGKAGLSFGPLTALDRFTDNESGFDRPLSELSQIRFF